MHCGCITSLTSSPWVPFLMCFCVLLSSGRLGPARAEVGLGFALLRLVQALPSSPSSAGLVTCPSAFAFFFLAFSGFCPFRARCVVLVFALSLFSCVPLFVSWLGKFHFIFIFISFSFHFHLHLICPAVAGRVCVCVCTIWIDVKLLICRGATAHLPMLPNEATEDVVDGFMAAWTCTCNLYIYIALPPGAFKSQLGGTYILSLLFYTVTVYCVYAFIYTFFIVLVGFTGVFFARLMHSTSTIR